MTDFEDYEGFVEKFKPKKTTDDCYTPTEIYEAVKGWACEKWGIDPDSCVRPFYPGGDFYRFDYPEGCTVLDNPPFSLLAKICAYYLREGIPFFLFAPSLTALSGRKLARRMNHVITDCCVTYANGAEVRTSFVTSYGLPTVYMTAPDLTELVNGVSERLVKAGKASLPKYEYPDHVLTAAMGQRYAKYGIEFEVKADECAPISALDAQRRSGKGIFGGGLLLSERAAAERAAAERAAAERAAAERWSLSARERRMVEKLSK